MRTFNGVEDASPYGNNNTANQRVEGSINASNPIFRGTTSLDNNQITWVAQWPELDLVDAQNNNTGRLQGADLNKEYSYGLASAPYNIITMGLATHARILHDKDVANDFIPLLNKYGVVSQ